MVDDSALDRESEDGIERGPGPFGLYVWLTVAVGALSDVVHGRADPQWLSGCLLAVFVGLYLAVLWLRLRTERHTLARRLLVPLTVTVFVLVAAYGHNMYTLLPLTSITFGAVIPWREENRPLPIFAVLGLSAASVLVGAVRGGSLGEVFTIGYSAVLSGFIVAVILRLTAMVRLLRATREELARTAVAEERLRFARDLHDLLGHTLSLMVVKAQAVRRLATRDPEVAAAQAADIETVGRQALQEVRQAVTGYRGRGVAAELDAARAALADAGIDVTITQRGGPLPPEPDALLGWVVREGVTNVIKHSGARTCSIEVTHRGGSAGVEIVDDGTGGAGGHGLGELSLDVEGNGLGGLRERTEAVGGVLESGRRRRGGFRLAATVKVAGMPVPTREFAT